MEAEPVKVEAMLTELIRWRDENDCEIEVLAFYGDIGRSKGTGDMVRRAKAANVKVRVIT